MSVQRLQAETSSTDFDKWKTYFSMGSPTQTENYLMQVAYYCLKPHLSEQEQEKLTLDQFIVKFEEEIKKRKAPEDGRAFFSAMLGVDM